MAFAISKEKIPSINQDSHETESESSVISSQLYLKSSHQTLDKNVVRKRIRHHKCLQKVRANLQALLDTCSTNYDYEHKLLEQGDIFCSP
ncbi:hypothetical protein RND71_032879 [Anisodus tanguticus]|uniref:Uncharacterized protein n=1 Tax=Anisodus tanguticus TaxID=243964 RepID=A0AAE1V3F9_9SOLA|nr:hypothetical protein RND71_032879 [Anisodus tanguticus]